jgi:tRNA (guanine37-N1)-methyltransferase
MKITILTLFPEMFNGLIENSIVKRAISKGIVEVEITNIRDYTLDKYGRVDTPPIGGGAGLIMKCQPIVDALKDKKTIDSHIILMSPRGKKYDQVTAHQYTNFSHLIIVCGHYEGIDERVNDYVDELISIGDYILTGGEIASMAIADSIIRLIDGAIDSESIKEETFEQGLLEYPQYTEPYDFEGKKVPDILYSGNHSATAKWRKKEALKLTRLYRPDLFAKYVLSKQDKILLSELAESSTPKWEELALQKGHKFIKK